MIISISKLVMMKIQTNSNFIQIQSFKLNFIILWNKLNTYFDEQPENSQKKQRQRSQQEIILNQQILQEISV